MFFDRSKKNELHRTAVGREERLKEIAARVREYGHDCWPNTERSYIRLRQRRRFADSSSPTNYYARILQSDGWVRSCVRPTPAIGILSADTTTSCRPTTDTRRRWTVPSYRLSFRRARPSAGIRVTWSPRKRKGGVALVRKLVFEKTTGRTVRPVGRFSDTYARTGGAE